jgi:uncharacterized repeat protein (TIGR02543 family)
MTMERLTKSGWAPAMALLAALFVAALLALAGCENTGDTTAPSLVGIEAATTKSRYIKGESLDLGTISIIGTYSDGINKIIPVGDADVAGYDKEQSGPQTVTVAVEEKTASFAVTVTEDAAEAKEILAGALDAALEDIAGIVVSGDGGGVPEGVKWVAPAQKAALDQAVAAARTLAASGGATAEDLVAALAAVQEAAKELIAVAETQTGTESAWSYTVAFSDNGGTGTDPAIKTVENPATTVGTLPKAPTRTGYAFDDWNTRANGSGSNFGWATPVAGNLTVYAQWTAIVHAQAPAIRTQPRDAAYTLGDEATALSVTAASPDDGTLSYQWHSASGSGGWTAISGATESSYTPPTNAAGAVPYYVRVTNTNNAANGTKTAAANSATVIVTVNPAPVTNAQAPAISVQPLSVACNVGDTPAALSVAASSPDGGVLSYQWFNNSGDSDEWTAISGATAASHTPPTAAAGVVSYYARVTNTKDSVNGVKSLSANSNTATITVSLVNAQAPAIRVQPQNGVYNTATAGDAVPLAVTAESPDGGTLSYQWHSRGGSSSPWVAIEGAAAASYTPPAAELGTVYYYVAVTNTNNNASGRKTASLSSEAVSVTVTLTSAQTPNISAQPRNGIYAPGDTPAALFVTASSPDGGTLSYQWHSRGGSSSPWAAINGATTASYPPPTGVKGTVYYYVAVGNTNNTVDGLTTMTRNSAVASVLITDVGTGSFSFEAWANDDGSLISNMPEYFDISRRLGQSMVLTAADSLTEIQWSLNGIDLPPPRGAAQSFTIEAAAYPLGNYTLGLKAKKGAVPCSIEVTVTVDN